MIVSLGVFLADLAENSPLLYAVGVLGVMLTLALAIHRLVESLVKALKL